MSDRWATFDCYGTLVDWMRGIRTTMAGLWPEADAGALLTLYHQLEPAAPARRGGSYRPLLARAHDHVPATARLDLPAGQEDALGASLPRWPVFAEVPAA